MEYTRKQQWYIGMLFCAIFLVFFFGWLTVEQVIAMPEANGWFFSIALFSLGISMLCLVPFSSKKSAVLYSAALLAFVPSFFFVQDPIFILFVCAGVALSVVGLFHMRQDMELNMSIHVRRSMQYGIGWIVFSFALVIASFYSMQMRYKSGEELLQKLSISQTSNVILTQALGLMNPEFKKANKENVTVDEFLVAFQKNQSEGDIVIPILSDAELLQIAGMKPTDPRAPQTLIQIKKELDNNATTISTQKLVLEQGRKQLSDIVGTSLSGQEPIADVLSKIIDQRIRTYFKPDMASGSSSLLPFVLSIILFITVWSLGSILSFVWRIVTALLFTLFRRCGIIEVKKVMVEQEVIE